MRIESVQKKIKHIAKRWAKQYPPGDTAFPQHEAKGKVLSELDPQKATAETIAEIIGNDSWTSLERCDECWGYNRAIVVLTSNDFEDSEFRICRSCLGEALELLEHEKTEERSK